MSTLYRVRKPLAGIDFRHKSEDELNQLFRQILDNKIHGLSFSAYLEGQQPGSQLHADDLRRRMKVIAPYIKWVRSFSCVEGNELIPQVAREFGLKTLVGAWIESDREKNDLEIEGLINVAKAGLADIVAVGNEVLLRNDLSLDQLIALIRRVKKELPGIPVGYVDAHYIFTDNPQIVEECDVLLANCYPFWEGYSIEHSFLYLKEMYHRVKRVSHGREVIISETGWPNLGSPEREAVPSYENAIRYFINAYSWALEDEIDIFYFASFDETWKIAAEGDVGAYWGLWDKDGNLKFG